MTTTITIPQEYGYTLLVASASFFSAVWHGMRVGPFRKAAKIPYPNAYASEERIAAAATPSDKQALYLFNCAQRAHYNFLENYVAAAPAALIAGLAYPRASAITFGIWNVFRIVYALGYTDKTRSDGKGRLAGSGFWIAEAVLFGMVGKMGYDLVLA